MLIGRALSAASSRSSAAMKFFVDFDILSAIVISWIIMEIQTHKKMRRANFVENRVRVL